MPWSVSAPAESAAATNAEAMEMQVAMNKMQADMKKKLKTTKTAEDLQSAFLEHKK